MPRLERVMGIGPTQPAWKAGVLPLNYTRASCIMLKDYNKYRKGCQQFSTAFLKVSKKFFYVLYKKMLLL